jgi:hypothetical protein
VVERRGVGAAFGRSRELVRGHGWQVLGVIVLVVLLALLAGILVGVLASGLGNGGVAVVQWAADVIISPFTALVGAVMYFSLRRLHGEATAGPPGGGEVAPPPAEGPHGPEGGPEAEPPRMPDVGL